MRLSKSPSSKHAYASLVETHLVGKLESSCGVCWFLHTSYLILASTSCLSSVAHLCAGEGITSIATVQLCLLASIPTVAVAGLRAIDDVIAAQGLLRINRSILLASCGGLPAHAEPGGVVVGSPFLGEREQLDGVATLQPEWLFLAILDEVHNRVLESSSTGLDASAFPLVVATSGSKNDLQERDGLA